jgi:hypothetical protein
MDRDMKPFSAAIEIISDMKVNPDGTAVVSRKKISFLIGPHIKDEHGVEIPGGASYHIEDLDKDTTISLAKLYTDYADEISSIEQAVFDEGRGNVEVRARLSNEAPQKNTRGKSVPITKGLEQWTNTSLKLEVAPTTANTSGAAKPVNVNPVKK